MQDFDLLKIFYLLYEIQNISNTYKTELKLSSDTCHLIVISAYLTIWS